MRGTALSKGRKLAKEGRFEEALPHLEKGAAENSDSPEAWLALAACYFRLDRNDDFRESIRKALAINPNHAPTLKYLKTTTGAETIPARETGREKIFMDERGTSGLPLPGDVSAKKAAVVKREKTGCLGATILSGLIFACLAVWVWIL